MIFNPGIIHYTGMGKIGDQVLVGNQNGTLYHSNTNGIEVHFFEAENKQYEYRGIVKLIETPYQEMQPGDDGNLRKVWMFPLKAINLNAEKHKDTEKVPEPVAVLKMPSFIPSEEQVQLLIQNLNGAREGNTIEVMCIETKEVKKYAIQPFKQGGVFKLPPIPNKCLGQCQEYRFRMGEKDYELIEIFS